MSLKKTTIVVICILVVVTLYTALTSGGSMGVELTDDAIRFSGVQDYVREISYGDILSAQVIDLESPGEARGGFESGNYRCGAWECSQLGQYDAFITVKCSTCVLLELADGGRYVFNYNDPASTQGVYDMLIKNL